MSIELYCIGHIHHKCSWCKNCTNDKHNAVCPYFEAMKIYNYEVDSHKNVKTSSAEEMQPSTGGVGRISRPHYGNVQHDGEMVSHDPHEVESGRFDSSSCYTSPQTKPLSGSQTDESNPMPSQSQWAKDKTGDNHSQQAGERDMDIWPVPLQSRAELGSPADTYSFQTACPDYTFSGNMQLDEEYFR